jgi:hypothetical protein
MGCLTDPSCTHAESVAALSQQISFHEWLTEKNILLSPAVICDTEEYTS